MNDMINQLKSRAYQLRVLSLQATTQAGSGHPTSALSAADLVAALFFHAMKFDPAHPDKTTNDRFILSKGHAAPVLYAAWKEIGVLSYDELMSLRKFNSVLEGHPTPRFAYTEAATGSLGCGLSIGLGMTLAGRILALPFYTYVLLGDSEMAEGSVWEAVELAAHYNTSHLIALVDLNRLGQTTETLDDHDPEQHAHRWKAFGWYTICINGHAMEEIVAALDEARAHRGQPTVIVARTLKGYGLEGIEDKEDYHGRALTKEQLPSALEQLKKRFADEASLRIESRPVTPYVPQDRKMVRFEMPTCPYTQETFLAPRKAFGESLALMGSFDERILSLDAEVKNSTYAQTFEKKFPERFIQCYIAEQNMISMAVGLESRGFIPVTSTFACFLTRAHDQIRMAAINRSPLRIVGSHAGVSIGEDGPSQMGLEDIGMMRALPESIVLYPCDAVSTFSLVYRMLLYDEGISYLRLTRADTQTIYDPSTPFVLGGSHVLRHSDHDQVCIVAAGITVYEALKAYEELKVKNIFVSVIDLYSIKPLDRETLITQAHKARKKIITVEDHFLQGGLGEAVCYALKNEGITIECLAVKELSRSGSPKELLSYHKIDHTALVQAVYRLNGSSP